MQVGRKFRIYPSEEQQQKLSQWIGCQRVVRNAKIEESRYLYWLKKAAMFSARTPDLSKEKPELLKTLDSSFAQYKGKENQWLRAVPSQLLRNGVTKTRKAFTNFFAGQTGFPQRKNARGSQSVLLTNELFTIADGKLFVGTKRHPLGFVKWVPHREYTIPKMLTITRHADGQWECSFTFDDETTQPSEEDLLVQHSFTPIGRILGYDRGIVNPFYGSNDVIYDLSDGAKRR